MTNHSRRQFLLAGASASALAAFQKPRDSFAGECQILSRRFGTEPDFEKLADQYSLAEGLSYLNHASIGTMAKPVQKARQKYLEICETNPWFYMWSGAWDQAREQVREKVSRLLNCDKSEVAITHNTTEMFNLLANGTPLKPKDEVLFSSLCHAGASLPFVHHQKHHKQYRVRRFDFPVDMLPELKADDIVNAYREAIRPETRMLVIPHIDNTVGVRYPLREIAKMAKAKGVEWVAVDAAQTVGMLPVDFQNSNVDMLATSPHKWLGAPKGIGIAILRKGLNETIAPMWTTWGQDRWSDSARRYEDYGTRNLAELLTLGDSIDFLNTINLSQREERLRELWLYTREQVDQEKSLSWKSPNQWPLGGSLYSIGVDKKRSVGNLAKSLFKDHQVVVRPFTTLGLNHLRVSPNVFTSKAQIARFISLIR